MPGSLAHYYFAKDVISNLEDKYKDMFNFNVDKLFLYANFFDLPYYFTLNTFRKNDKFKLGNKLHTLKIKELIKSTILFIQNNSYDKDNVFFLYAIVSHYILDKVVNPYLHSICALEDKDFKSDNYGYIKNAIDYKLFNDIEGKTLDGVNLYKEYKTAYIFNFSDLQIINHTINNTYYFSKGEEYFKVCLKNFKKYYKNTKLSLFKIKSKCNIKYNPYPKLIGNYYTKKYKAYDYLNVNHNVWVNHLTNNTSKLNFYELLEIAKKMAKEYYEAINNYLFYNNDKQFKTLFEELELKI